MPENPYEAPKEVGNVAPAIGLARIVVLVFCLLLAVVNGPRGLYWAWVDQVTPYGFHSRAFWVLTALVNVAVGTAGVWWALRRRPRIVKKR